MSTAQVLIWGPTLILTVVSGALDWRSRRIPNWLTVPSFFLGIILHAILGGSRGALFAVEGAGLALGLLLVPVLMRMLGAGDWKLMGAVGAFTGPVMFLFVLLASVLISGAVAVVHILQVGRVRETLGNLLVLVRGFAVFGLKPNPRVSLDNPGSLKLPYGVAVAAATILCFCAARWVA
jgi:prepilin peptidase CpaA